LKPTMMTLTSEKASVIKKAFKNALNGVADSYTPWLEKKEILVARGEELVLTGIGRLIIDRYLHVDEVRKLWRVQADPNNFIRSKSKCGISSYTFLEACKYRGYIAAFRQAYGFWYSDSKYQNSQLVNSFMSIHYDCIRMIIETEGNEPVDITVSRDGQILLPDGLKSDLHYREWEASVLAKMKLSTNKTFKSELLRNDQIKGLPRITPKVDKGATKEGE